MSAGNPPAVPPGGRPDIRTDVVVVGGGVIGLATALELTRSGRDVVVVSDAPRGVGASAGNAGMIVPSHVVPLSAPGVIAQGLRWLLRKEAPFHLKPRPSLALFRWLFEFRAHCTHAHVERSVPVLRDLSLASVEGFLRLAEQADDFDWSPTGLMMVSRTEGVTRALEHEAGIAKAAGLKVRILDEAGVRAQEPNLRSDALGAVLFEQDARLDPDLLLAALGRRLEAEGATALYGERAISLAPGRVETSTRVLSADHVVIAAGAWSGGLLTGLSIQPAKGYSVSIAPPPDGPSIPMILMEDRVTITPMSGKLRFGGTLSLAGFDPRIDSHRAAPILREVNRYSPQAGENQPQIWSGFRPASPDGLPYIGRLGKGLWVNTGHGMMGVSLAPASGRLLCELMTGQVPLMDPSPFDPHRLGTVRLRQSRRTSPQ